MFFTPLGHKKKKRKKKNKKIKNQIQPFEDINNSQTILPGVRLSPIGVSNGESSLITSKNARSSGMYLMFVNYKLCIILIDYPPIVTKSIFKNQKKF